MILRDIWTKRSPQRHPYLWLSTEPGELCSMEVARQLAECFPSAGFVRRDESGRQHRKRYRNYSRPLGDPNVEGDLPSQWRQLLAELLLPAYRSQVARLLGQEPARELEIRLVRHGPGDGLGPHTDRDDKLFSHVIYLNSVWHEEWGGCLEVLYGNDPNAVAGRIVPRLGTSALMAQARNSWHQVTPVSDACPTDRSSLLVHGLR